MSAMIRLNQAKKLIRRLAAELHAAHETLAYTIRLEGAIPDNIVALLREARDFAPPTKTELKAKRKAEFKAALKAST